MQLGEDRWHPDPLDRQNGARGVYGHYDQAADQVAADTMERILNRHEAFARWASARRHIDRT